MKKLNQLHWSPKWTSHIGCLKGCTDYLGLDFTEGWLFGGTGHAFVVNIHENLCPSGPTAWNTKMIFEAAAGLGYQAEGVFNKSREDLADTQQKAWDFTRWAIDKGQPVYGWELEIPEFYVVFGYDDVGYYYSGPGADDGKGPKPWQELGDSEIGVIEMYRIRPGTPAADEVVVRSAFQKTLQHAENPKDWIGDKYASGVKGFDVWIESLENGKADRFGMGYNTAVWAECRTHAVLFLEEANERLDGKEAGLFNEAIVQYQASAENLNHLAKVFPFTHEETGTIPLDADCQAAVDFLRKAREAEKRGLASLGQLVTALG